MEDITTRYIYDFQRRRHHTIYRTYTILLELTGEQGQPLGLSNQLILANLGDSHIPDRVLCVIKGLVPLSCPFDSLGE